MKLDRLTLEQLIQETLDEWTSDQSVDYGSRRTTSAPARQKKVAKTPPVRDAEKRFIDSIIKHKYMALEFKEQKALTLKLTQVIDAAVERELADFTPTPLPEDREK